MAIVGAWIAVVLLVVAGVVCEVCVGTVVDDARVVLFLAGLAAHIGALVLTRNIEVAP